MSGWGKQVFSDMCWFAAAVLLISGMTPLVVVIVMKLFGWIMHLGK